MKVMIITDTHVGIHNNSKQFLEYHCKFYRELVFPYCDAHGITHIIHMGDFFDSPKLVNTYTMHKVVQEILKPMDERNMVMIALSGNHDQHFRHTSEVCSIESFLGAWSCIRQVSKKPERLVLDDHYLCAFFPWSETPFNLSSNFLDNVKRVFGHFEFDGYYMQTGQPAFKGDYTPQMFLKNYPLNRVHSGHFHTKNGIYMGASMQHTWADANDPKYIHVLDTDTDSIEAIENPFTIYLKINYTDSTPFDFDYNTVPHHYVRIVMPNEGYDKESFEQFHKNVIGCAPYGVEVVYPPPNITPVSILDSDNPVNMRADPWVTIEQHIENLPGFETSMRGILKDLKSEYMRK